jgi:hypothetical protein
VLAESERTATEWPSVIAAVRLLILTGCRLSEILTLQWSYVDVEAACLRLPDSKTGAKVVHLNAPALAVLAGLEREDGSPWVICGGKPGAHLINLEKPWRRIRAAAGIPDVRLHDLRHSFASVAVGLGEGLPMIGKLLGHTQVQTTARYAHLAADPVKVRASGWGAAIVGMMAGGSAEAVPLSKAKREITRRAMLRLARKLGRATTVPEAFGQTWAQTLPSCGKAASRACGDHMDGLPASGTQAGALRDAAESAAVTRHQMNLF